MKKLTLFLLLWFLFQANSDAKPLDQKQTIVTLSGAAERIQYGVSRLVQSLKTKGYPIQQKVISLQSTNSITANGVLVASVDQVSLGKLVPKTIIDKAKKAGKEGFVIETVNSKTYIIGADASGTLYGCLELIERLETKKAFPKQLAVTDHPQMVLRGTCIGLQKPDYLPGRDVYEYPYTPETFPWFYDKDLWIKYLDMMVDNRYNSLYLWNGHPFSSLIKLKDYPYAVEVNEATFKKNEEIFRFLTHEADKRGIWVIQMFYNIIIPKPFAEKHQLKTQDRNRPIIPLIADYTQKSIAAFVQKYPNVGLMVALGEAMEGVGQDDIDWFTKTIIPGVKDGLKAAGIQTEPPIVLRAHDTDAPAVMKAALPLYKNLYTENKFNGEALTTYEPRGAWAALNRKLAEIGSINISNVHILANLEPFRYGSVDFIQKSVQAMDRIYGARGLHLYPQSSYWDWPYTADRTKDGKRILQIDRDWLWYSAWARYAWNANRNRETEKAFWAKKLANQFGTSEKSGSHLLNAYEEAGEISPKLLRRYGITDGNRQTLTLGMLMTQLINPFRYGLFTLLYESEAPEGEMIIDYAEKEWKGQQHIGETPVQIAKEVVAHGKAAVASINQVDGITKRTEEFARIKNDIYCHDAMANFYASKVQSALWVLRFKYSNQVADLEKALPLLQRSVAYYATLTKLTNDSYLYANSMQTKQRKIPMRGVDQTFIHWKEMLPVFQKELNKLQHSIDSLKNISSNQEKPVQTFANADVQIDGAFKTVKLNKGAMLWNDTLAAVKEITPQLVGLNAMQLSKSSQLKQGTQLSFTNKKPVKVLVAYFSQKGSGYLPAPTLEIDASANNYGQSEIKISNALVLEGMPPMNVHTFTFAAGKNTLTLAKGAAMILGFVDDTMPFRIFNAGLDGRGRDIDWLFE